MKILKCLEILFGKKISKIFLFTISLYIIYKILILSYINSKENASESKVLLEYRLVHLDFKGAPPKLKYLETVLPVLKKAGANGLLVEYEDMFPFEGRVRNLSAYNCYGKKELSSFLKVATSLGFEIIPLIQTFGHMEMALKLEEFRNLREDDDSPDSICPHRIGSLELILDMVTQIMDFHSKLVKIRWLHIGCDEVFHINSCQTCRQRKLTNFEIFENHISTISKKISLIYPDLKLIIWDDMLRAIPSNTMENMKFGNNIELMVWVYGPVIKTIIPYHTMYKYVQNFRHIWIASAFKGANKQNSIIPDLKNRYENHVAWLSYINNFSIIKHRKKELYQFNGIALTGWSRFNHFAPLCELLPNSLPSIILNLELIKEFNKSNSQSCINCHILHQNVYYKLNSYMNCDEQNSPIDVLEYQHLEELQLTLGNCNFDGSKLHKILIRLDEIKLSIIKSYLNKQFKDRNVLDSYLSPNSLSIIDSLVLIDYSVDDKAKLLKYLVFKFREILGSYYDVYTIEEYVKFKTDPLFEMLQNLKIEKNYKIEKVWKRGPTSWNKVLL